jgi:hypothetical protein
MKSGVPKLELHRQDARNRLGRLRQTLEELAKMQEELRIIEAQAAQRDRAFRQALTQPSADEGQRARHSSCSRGMTHRARTRLAKQRKDFEI